MQAGNQTTDRTGMAGQLYLTGQPDNPNNEYPRLNPSIAGFGGGLMIYKPSSFVRIQDVSLTYNLPSALAKKIKAEQPANFWFCQESCYLYQMAGLGS